MKRTRITMLSVVLLLHATALFAGTTRPARATLYKLTQESWFQQGCFDPCECPIMESVPLQGTFKLIPRPPGPLFTTYDVARVDWRVFLWTSTRHVAGSGTYTVGGEFAVQQQLTLDLSIDGGQAGHYDSGLVPGGGDFPAIDATISMHGMYCYDTVFRVKAEPVPVPNISIDSTGISWEAMDGATAYDVVSGSLSALGSGDALAAESVECLWNDSGSTALPWEATPAPGEIRFIVMRPVFDDDPGTYDEASAAQVGTLDPVIEAAPGACP